MKKSENILTPLANGLNSRLMTYDGSKVERFRLLASGWESTIYAFEKTQNGHSEPCVMRYYSPGMTQETANREWDILEFLGHQGYPVPRLCGSPPGDRLEGSLYFLMKRIDGFSLWSRLKTPAQYAVGLASIAELMTSLHRIDPQPLAQRWGLGVHHKTALGMMLEDWRNLIHSSTPMTDAFLPAVVWLEERIERLQEMPVALLHFDLHPENVIVEARTGRKVVIDWTGATVSDPRLDVFWAALLVGHQADEAYFDRMIESYEKASGLVLQDRGFFTALVCIRRIASILLSAVVGAEKLGMRDEVGANIARQVPGLRMIYRLLVTATEGMRIPMVESFLAQFPD